MILAFASSKPIRVAVGYQSARPVLEAVMGFFKWLSGRINTNGRPRANYRPSMPTRRAEQPIDPFLLGVRAQSIYDPSNPFGWTNPNSPNNPYGWTNPLSPNNPNSIMRRKRR
jgi:hypothetical protein